LSDASDEEILTAFEKAKLPDHVIDDLLALFEVVHHPIAVRSSSLLEDSHYQPFAGIYSTYMIPKPNDREAMMRLLRSAIKAVYASVFYRDSKAYLTATQNLIDQEKMAIVLQEVVGEEYNDLFFPTLSGVARSLNYYPIGDECPEDGIANIALGLGKYIVDGGLTLRFSPRHPRHILQLSSIDTALKETQRQFYALDLKNASTEFNYTQIQNLIERLRNKGWNFAFMGAKQDVKKVSIDLNINVENAVSFDFSDRGIRHAFQKMQESTAEYYCAVADTDREISSSLSKEERFRTYRQRMDARSFFRKKDN
jgi:phosphoenolpyruvate synthase/pyruvate phosphate dikinase